MRDIVTGGLLLLFIVILVPVSHAEHTHGPEAISGDWTLNAVSVQENQVVLETKGIVCSFCAFGAKKKLMKLDFIDRSHGKDKEIVTDIKKSQMTLSVIPSKRIELSKIQQAIKAAGYQLIAANLQLEGLVSVEGSETYLTQQTSGQQFRLRGDLGGISAGKTVKIQGHADGEDLASQGGGENYLITVDKQLM